MRLKAMAFAAPAVPAIVLVCLPALARPIGAEDSCQAHARLPPAKPALINALPPTTALPGVVKNALPAHIPQLLIAVDGSRNPEKVPIDLAYRHLARALAVPASSAPAPEIARRDVQFGRMGLSDAEKDTAIAALHGVHEQLESIAAERRGLDEIGDAGFSQKAELMRLEREELDSAAVRLRAWLSPAAAARLDEYVRNHVRSRIIVYGSLPR